MIRADLKAVRVGVLGAGDISDVYLRMIDRSPALDLVAVAGRTASRSQSKAQKYGARGTDTRGLLSDPSVEIILNLTPAAVHDVINRQILAAGKHLYSEKPLSLSVDGAREIAAVAGRAGLLAGGSPDTIFGAGHQAAGAILNSGALGEPVFGMAMVGHPGIEHFHPNPADFYRPGCEPPLDIGPYHILQWVTLLGPVRSVASASARGKARRTVKIGQHAGRNFPVEIATSYSALLFFDEAYVVLTTSLDVAAPTVGRSELFCTDGALALADPNFFGGVPEIRLPGGGLSPVALGDDRPFGPPNKIGHTGTLVSDYRGVGLVEMALAVRGIATPRCSTDLMVHITEVAAAIVQSAAQNVSIEINTDCAAIPPLGMCSWDSLLVELTPSPFDL